MSQKNRLKRIFIFYFFAIVLSNFFRLNIIPIDTLLNELPFYTIIFINPLEAIGVLIGALFARNLLKKQKHLNYSIFGSSKFLSIIMILIPVSLVTILGLENSSNINPNIYGLVMLISTAIYCFNEEIGWRGYLQDELNDKSSLKKYALIGFLWYFWHLSFLKNSSLVSNLFILAVMIFASWGLGQVIEKTKSILAATGFHMVINIFIFNPSISTNIKGSDKILILIIPLIFYIFILAYWNKFALKKQNKRPTNS